MRAHALFQVQGSGLQRLGRYLLGIAGVLLIYFGLDQLFGLIAVDETILGYILRYGRYAAVAFWATFGAPWVFIKIGLARPVLKGGLNDHPNERTDIPESSGL